MSAGTDAVVTVLAGEFWGEASLGAELLSDEPIGDLRDMFVHVTTTVGDVVAGAMQVIRECPALLAEVEALDELGDWTEDDLRTLKAMMIAAGIKAR